MEFKRIISSVIKANIPGVAITTPEWERIENDIVKIATEFELEIVVWDATHGLHTNDKIYAEASQPLKAINCILGFKNSVIIFKNFNFNFKIPAIQQGVRDALQVSKVQGNILFFISVSGEVPAELEKELVIIEYEYPSSQDYIKILGNIIEEFTPEDAEKVAEALKGTTLNEAENITALALVANDLVINEETIKFIKKQRAMVLKKSNVLELYEPEDLPKVGGLEILKKLLEERKMAFTPEARAFGLPYPKGILVFGIPGTGKSLVAKTIAREWDMPLLIMGNVLDKYVGESEKRMKEALKQAEALAPCVLMIDEVEKFFAGVGSNNDSGVTSRVFGQLLTWMQEKKAPVFVVATANNVTKLPPEFLRKGRFDENFFVDLPSWKERKEIFEIHLSRKGRDIAKFDLDVLARETTGFTGAEIEQVVVSALFRAFSKGKELDTETITEIIKETTPLSATMKETIETMRAWGQTRAKLASLPEEPSTEEVNRRRMRM